MRKLSAPILRPDDVFAMNENKPGQISYASNGPGSLTHLTTAILAHKAGIELLHVPYQGAAALMTDLLAGRIGMTFTAASAALPLVASGKLRALAVTTGTRSRFSPDVPTLVESGFPDLSIPTWFAAVIRSATPTDTTEKLRKEFNQIVESEEYAAALEKRSMEVMPIAPERADDFLERERKLWSEAVQITGPTVD